MSPRGRYEVRRHMVPGVVAVWHVTPSGEQAILTTLGAEAVPVLAEALADYQAHGPKPGGQVVPVPRHAGDRQ